jgi:hypothetical protein
LNFLDRFSKKKKIHISNFIKIRPVGAEFLYAAGRTDMTKLTAAFRNFANAPKRLQHEIPTVSLITHLFHALFGALCGGQVSRIERNLAHTFRV